MLLRWAWLLSILLHLGQTGPIGGGVTDCPSYFPSGAGPFTGVANVTFGGVSNAGNTCGTRWAFTPGQIGGKGAYGFLFRTYKPAGATAGFSPTGMDAGNYFRNIQMTMTRSADANQAMYIGVGIFAPTFVYYLPYNSLAIELYGADSNNNVASNMPNMDTLAIFANYFSISPPTVPSHSPTGVFALTITGQSYLTFPSWAASSFVFGFTLGSCNSSAVVSLESSDGTLTTGNQLIMTFAHFQATGTYLLCMSPDYGQNWMNTTSTVTAIAPNSSVISDTNYVSSLDTAAFGAMSLTISNYLGFTTTGVVALTLSTSCSAQNLYSMTNINLAPSSVQSVTFTVPIVPGSFGICLGWTATSTMVFQTVSSGRLNAYVAVADSIEAISPTVAPVNYAFNLNIVGIAVPGAAPVTGAGSPLQLALTNTSSCATGRYYYASQFSGTTTPFIAVGPHTYPYPGVYQLCYTASGWAKGVLIAGVTLTLVSNAQVQITAVTPNVIGCGTAPIFNFAIVGSLPATATVLLGIGGCSGLAVMPIANGSAISFGVLSPSSCNAPTTYTVCLAVDGAVYTPQTPTITVKTVTTFGGISPSYVPYVPTFGNTFILSGVDVLTPPAVIRLSPTGTSCAGVGAVTVSYSDSYQNFPGLMPGDYDVCYSVGSTFTAVASNAIHVLTASYNSIQWFGGTFRAGRTGQTIIVVASSITPTANAQIYLTQASSCGAGSLSAGVVIVPYTSPMFLPVSSAFTPGPAILCFTFDQVAASIMQNGSTVMIVADATPFLTNTYQGANAQVASGQSLTLNITGPYDVVLNTLTFAPDGLCNSPNAWFVDAAIPFTAGLISPTFTIPSALAGLSTYTIYPCLSINGGNYASQKNPGQAIVVTTATTTSITALNPSSFIINTAVQAQFIGAVATPTTQIALSTDQCATRIANCTATYNVTTTGSFTLGPSCKFSNAGSLSVCYTTGVSGWLMQLLVSAAVTNDPDAGAITSLVPTIIGVGTTPTIQLAVATTGAGVYIGFTTSTCSTCNTSCEAITALTSNNVPLGAPFRTANPQWTVCYTKNNMVGWSTQVSFGVNMKTLQARVDSIGSMTPSAVGLLNTKTFTFTGIEGSITTFIAFSTDNCATVVGPSIKNMNVGNTTFTLTLASLTFSPGVYSLCYSTNYTYNWFKQAPSLTIVQATGSSVTAMDTTMIGENVLVNIGFTIDPNALSVDSFMAFAINNCSTSIKRNTISPDATGVVPLTTALSAGVYVICFSTQTGVWVQQGSLTLTSVGTTTTQLGAVTPSPIGINTQPIMSFPFAWVSNWTAVAFVAVNGGCGNVNQMQGLTPLTTSTTTQLGQSITVSVDTQFYVCYTTNSIVATPNWKQQTSGQIYVLAGTATSITNVSPSPIGANVNATVTLNVANGVTPTSFIGFASNQAGCINARQGTTKLTGTNNPLTITMASPISTAGPYLMCYSVDGVTYVAQTTPSSSISVVDAAPNSLSNMFPSTIGDSTLNLISISGFAPTPTTRVGFSATSDCASRFSEVAINSVGQSSFMMTSSLPSAGNYFVCYTTSNGATWVAQTLVTMHVVSATSPPLTSIAPNFFGTQLQVVLSIGGGAVSPFSVVGFAPAGSCLNGPYQGLTTFAGTITLPPTITTPGVYDTCYSVRNTSFSFVAQPGCQFTVATPSATLATTLNPTTIGAGIMQSFQWNVSDPRISPVTAMAFSLQGGDCSQAGQRLNQLTINTTAEWTMFSVTTPIVSGGFYQLCITYNGNTWTAQTDSTTILHVVAATPTSIAGVSPQLYQNNAVTTVTLTGVLVTPTSMFAFAQHGLCSVTRYAETDYSNPDVNGAVLMSSAITITQSALNMSLCYSVNGGLTWVEQNNLQVLVVTACDNLFTCESCHQSPFCTWCLPAAACTVNIDNATLCPATTNVGPGDPVGCPALTFPQHLSGSLAGRTNVTLMSNGRFFATDKLQCFWDFTFQTNVTEFVVTSPSTGWCLSPPGPAGVVGAYLSMKYDGAQFTLSTTNQRAFWIYYDCAQRLNGLCTSCYNLLKPDCGVCFETGACQADFECNGLWGGSSCPDLDYLDPPQVNYRGEVPVYITGSLFVNVSTMACYFGDQWANATYVNESMVTCIVPPGEPSTVVAVTVLDRGQLYSTDTLNLLYTPDPVPAAIIPPPTVVPPDRLTIPLVSTIVALLVIGVIILVIVLNRRRKARQALLPPPLTAALKEAIIFGDNVKASPNAKQILPNVAPLLELLMIPNSPVLIALTKVMESTEADNISRALVYVTESRGRTVEVMKSLVTAEVESAESMATLFRTNSFVTKMFKVYSKIVGLEYVHTTLGYELNASLASAKSPEGEEAALDVKDDSNDDVQLNKLILLTVCQRVLLAITKSEKEVPTEFRELFAHIKLCMTSKFRITSESLARLTAGNLTATLVDTRVAMGEKAALTLQELNNLQMSLVSGIAGGQMDPQTQHQLSGVSHDVESISNQLIATLKACKDLEASMYPDSEEAKRVKHEHELAQNSIAVGGFFFLRFIVPAITAPDSYALVRETPDANTIKTLVLCGKVLQNLSNDKEMGGKEEYMAKMNEFIISNRKPMRKFQEHLMVKRDSDSGSYEAVPVPQRLVDAASVQLYEYMISRFKHIMAALDAPTVVEDPQRGLQRAQMANMLVHVMQTVNNQVGDATLKSTRGGDQFESIVSSRKSGVTNATAHISMRTVQADDSMDSGAGLSSASETASVTADPTTPNPAFAESGGAPLPSAAYLPPPPPDPSSLTPITPLTETPLLPPPINLASGRRSGPSDSNLFS